MSLIQILLAGMEGLTSLLGQNQPLEVLRT